MMSECLLYPNLTKVKILDHGIIMNKIKIRLIHQSSLNFETNPIRVQLNFLESLNLFKCFLKKSPNCTINTSFLT